MANRTLAPSSWLSQKHSRNLQTFASEELRTRVLLGLPSWAGPLEKLVNREAEFLLIKRGGLFRTPTSAEDFCNSIDHIISDHAKLFLQYNLANFDRLAGLECTELFIQERTIPHWLKHIIDFHFFEAMISQYDGADDEPSGYSSMLSSAAPTLAVQQITLEGPDVLQAWRANPDTRRLSYVGNSQNQVRDPNHLSSTWTPRTVGSNYVYHGTSAHLGRNLVWPTQFTVSPFNALQARVHRNQMCPEGTNVVFTTFSPMRAFLWAAFTDTLTALIPTMSQSEQLQRTWSCGGQSFTGVVVFQFSVTQPAPQGLSCEFIPEDKEEAWGKLSLNPSTQLSWAAYKHLHHKNGTQWPDVVHGREYGVQRTGLVPFRCNLWRTTWKGGEAVETLNRGHRKTFAISFKVADQASLKAGATNSGQKDHKKSRKDDEDKDDKDNKGGRRHGTFGKKLLLRVKNSMHALKSEK